MRNKAKNDKLKYFAKGFENRNASVIANKGTSGFCKVKFLLFIWWRITRKTGYRNGAKYL
jgi:hypothetical protein